MNKCEHEYPLTYESTDCTVDTSLPRITLAILFYNQLLHVKAVVNSAVNQDYRNTEIILSDDGSTDGTAEALLSFVKTYHGPHRLVLNINKTNLGIGGHFKKVFAMSTGEWIATSGGDDISAPNRLTCIARYSKQFPNVSAIGCASRQLSDSGVVLKEIVEVSQPVIYQRYTGGEFDYELSPSGNARMAFIAGALAAWRRDVIHLHDFPDGIIAEDVVLALRAILIGDILFIPEILVDRRLGGISTAGHKHPNRAVRQKYRRRVARMCYLSENAVFEESSSYPFEVPREFLSRIRHDSSVALLRCFELPLKYHKHEYCEALRNARKQLSFRQLFGHASGCGNLVKFLRVVACSFLFKERMLSRAQI